MSRIAERKIIGHLILSDNLHQIIEIDSKYFLTKIHQEIHQSIKLLERKGEGLSVGNLILELNRQHTEDVAPIISEIVTSAYESSEVFDSAALLKELEESYLRHECLELALKIQKIANDKILNTVELINAVRENTDLFVSGIALEDKYPLKYIAEGIAEKLDSLEKGIKPIPTGLKELDDITDGLAPQELTILGGRPGDGKTYIGLKIADTLAKNGKPVIIFSAEMSTASLASRYLGMEYFAEYSEILPSSKLTGFVPMTEQELMRVYSVYNKRLEHPIFVQEKSGSLLKIEDIKKDLLTVKESQGEVGLVVIDYLQLISNSENGELKRDAIEKTLARLRCLAREFNCPFLILAQLGRASASRSEKRPYVTDLADSGNPDKYADMILLLYRDSVLNEQADPEDLEIFVAKNRTGRAAPSVPILCSFNMATGVLKSRD